MFDSVEIHHWRGWDRYTLAGFPLEEVFFLTPIKVNAQILCLLARNETKTTKNTLIIKNVLEETRLPSELLREVLILASGDLMTVFQVRSLCYIMWFDNAKELNILLWILLMHSLFHRCMCICSIISENFKSLTHRNDSFSLHFYGKILQRTQIFLGKDKHN